MSQYEEEASEEEVASDGILEMPTCLTTVRGIRCFVRASPSDNNQPNLALNKRKYRPRHDDSNLLIEAEANVREKLGFV